MTAPPTSSFRLGATASGLPGTVEAAERTLGPIVAEGGSKVRTSFAGDLGPMHAVADRLARHAGAAWTHVDEASSLGYDFLDPDLPASYVDAGGGRFVVQTRLDADVTGTAQGDGTWAQAGISQGTLVVDGSPVNTVVSAIEKTGPALAGAALLPAIKVLLGSIRTFFQSFFSEASSAAAGGATDASAVAAEAGEVAAEDAAVDGEVLAADAAMSVAFPPAAIVGIVIAVAILVVTIILFFLSKTMTAMVRIYNLTDQEVHLRITHRHDLEITSEPATGRLPPPGVPPAPPGVTPSQPVVYRADYVFQNSSSIKGIGAVLQARAAGEVPSVTFLLDVPAVGDNSLWVGLGDDRSGDTVWSDEAGAHHVTHMTTMAGPASTVLAAATNRLDHESPSPVTGRKGYNYEYLVVLSTASRPDIPTGHGPAVRPGGGLAGTT